MKCLVVISHPLSGSLCKAFADKIAVKLVEKGHDVFEEDLYAQNFKPALTVSERESYYGDYDSTSINEQVRRLQEAEALVLVFPTWWFGFPAILKGWFDRVWGPGIAYDHASDFGPIEPRLNNLRHVLVVTTLGSPWWVDRLVMWQPVKKVTKVALLGTCAKRSKLDFLSLYNSEKLVEKDIEKFINRITLTLDRWR